MRIIRQMGYVTLSVPDEAAAAAWYARVLGLETLDGRDGTRVLGGPAYGPALILRRGASVALVNVGGFATVDALDALMAHAAAARVAHRAAPVATGQPGLIVRDASGIDVEVSAGLHSRGSGSPGVVDIRKFSHATLRVPDLEASVAFYTDQLGFRISDRLSTRFVWMRCNSDHHGLAMVAAPAAPGLHHLAFELADWSEIKRASDHLHALGVRLEAGPLRHGPGRNIAIYFRDLNGVRIELTCEMEQLYHDDHRPGVWPEDGTFNVWHDASAPASWREATPALMK